MFVLKMVMCHAALNMKRNKKTEVIGTSTFFWGVPPSVHVVGRYGPDPCGIGGPGGLPPGPSGPISIYSSLAEP
jgi:hypothetical protein